MSNELGGITNAAIRDTVGTKALNAVGLVIDGTNVENVSTTAAVTHIIDGVFHTAYAQTDELDLSGVAVIAAKDGASLSEPVDHPARSATLGSQTLVYILACVGTTPYIIEPTLDVAAANDDADYSLSVPRGYCPFGAIKIVRLATDVADFQLGVDDMSGITGRTATFYDLSVCPPSVALMLKGNGFGN